MKQQFLLPLLLLMSALAAAGQPTAPQTPPLTKAEQEVMSQNQAYCDAIVKGDVERLTQILADDFIITSGDGNLRDTDLHLALLGGADLRGADLAGCNLTGADLAGAQLQGITGREAILGLDQAQNLNRAFLH